MHRAVMRAAERDDVVQHARLHKSDVMRSEGLRPHSKQGCCITKRRWSRLR
jgi:hypothetical protein